MPVLFTPDRPAMTRWQASGRCCLLDPLVSSLGAPKGSVNTQFPDSGVWVQLWASHLLAPPALYSGRGRGESSSHPPTAGAPHRWRVRICSCAMKQFSFSPSSPPFLYEAALIKSCRQSGSQTLSWSVLYDHVVLHLHFSIQIFKKQRGF